VRKLIGIISIGLGALFVIWFFMAVTYSIMDPRKRGPIEICLTIVFLILGLVLVVYGSKRSAK
jgi:TRAP-type mannitol/chloroaromatic compound transport system permease small subunit